MLGLRDAEARQRAERDQATVLSTVAHELRAPLTSVTGFTSSLLRRWDRFTDEQKRLMIETIEADATRLTRLITELLDISRLDSDSLNLRLGPVDLHALLDDARRALRARPSTGAVELRLGATAVDRGTAADVGRHRPARADLLQPHRERPAARRRHRHRDPRPRAAASARRPSPCVVHIDDEGVGIPPSDREKIFGRFWHGPSNASTGLGLYVVRGLVEAHGGSVLVTDNDAGRGALRRDRCRAGLPDVVGS